MRSALYRGSVWHRRSAPHEHDFRYGLHLVCLDLDELPILFRGRWFWSLEKWNWVSFRRADYLGPREKPLREAIQDRVEEVLGRRPRGRVEVLTQLRTLGYAFNPVSFYFCNDAAGAPDAIVAEITNTPWGERHSYVLDAASHEQRDGGPLVFRFQKDFHVSPFFDMTQTYEWRFARTPERVEVLMTNLEGGREVFQAGLACARQPMTASNLALALCRYPLQPLRLHASIYWQAACLYLKRTPFFTHPRKRAPAQDAPSA